MRTDDYKQSTYTPAVPSEDFSIACDSSQLVHTWREYAGNRVYENGVLSRLLFDGGYVSFRDSVPTYHYYIKDYLGNNRIVADAHGNVEEVNHYYPYGALMGDSRGTGLQPYKYIGKELDRTHGLDWYDHGARHYDPITGRWNTMDPMCEKYYGTSPYASCGDDPVNALDEDGDSIAVLNMGYGTYQHLAILIQDKEGKWRYFSFNGTTLFIKTEGSIGGGPTNDNGERAFNTPQEFLDSKYNTRANSPDEKREKIG